jgi:ABC-type glycerol-3-phosphate transport system permease component
MAAAVKTAGAEERMVKPNKKKVKVSDVLITLLIAVIVIIEIYPIFWMLTASLKQQYEWAKYPAYMLNRGFYWQNYIDAWNRGHMSIYFRNSLIYTLISLVFIVYFSATVGFCVTKMQWKWRERVKQYFELGIMVPVATALIPLFQIFQKTKAVQHALLPDHHLYSIRPVAFHLPDHGLSPVVPGRDHGSRSHRRL